jgi:SAM-dependent methyltransferase
MLAGCFGPVAVQVGEEEFGSLVRLSNAAFCYSASMEPPESGANVVDLRCIPEQLPFEARSVGLVVLPHVLEFSDYPHQILREVERILMPEGHLAVLGFNPFSIWGLAGLVRRKRMPWNGQFASLARVKDWLQLLNFELTAGRMVYYRPPVQSERVQRRLRFLENAGDRWWPLGAAVYAVLACKRELGVTPLNPNWKRRSHLGAGLAKPVARVRHAAYEQIDGR